jgi:hypothetical protein
VNAIPLLVALLLFVQPPEPAKNAEPAPAADKASAKEQTPPAELDAGKNAELLAAEFDKDVPTVVKLRAIASEPYKVRIWLTLADHPRVTPGLRQGVVEEIHAAAERYLGSSWTIDYATPPANAPISPDAPVEDMPEVKKLGTEYEKLDKVLWADVAVDTTRAGVPPFVVTVREYDGEFNKWGPAVKRTLAPDDQLPVNVFRLLHRQFRAVIGVVGIEERMLRVVVKGAALQSPDSPFPLLAFGAPLKITRDIMKKGQMTGRYEIPWTYLVYRSTEPDRRVGRCSVLSSIGMPVDNAMLRRGRAMGLAASNSEDAETEVRFVQLTTDNMPGDPPGRRPVPGYEVLLLVQDQVTPVLAGSTDRRGRITLSSSKLDPTGQSRPQVCIITLRIGKITVATFPMVPGDEPRREIVVNADPLLPEVSGRVGALQEEVVDTLARQAILSKRLKTVQEQLKKVDADDNPELKTKLKEVAAQLSSLPGNKEFQQKLDAIKSEAKKRNEKEYKQKSFGKHVQRLFAGIEKVLKERQIGLEVKVSESSDDSKDGK